MPEDLQPHGDEPVGDFAALPRSVRRRLILLAMLRAGIVTTVLLIAYAMLPFTLVSQTRYAIAVSIGLAIVAAVLVGQFWQTARSPYPRLRAVEAVMTSGPLFIVVFATTTYVIGQLSPDSYTQPMTRLDALYFSVTTFATVGYGDLSPVSQPARLVAMVQMICGLLLVGVIAKLLFGLAQDADRRRVRRDPADQNRSPRHPPSRARAR